MHRHSTASTIFYFSQYSKVPSFLSVNFHIFISILHLQSSFIPFMCDLHWQSVALLGFSHSAAIVYSCRIILYVQRQMHHETYAGVMWIELDDSTLTWITIFLWFSSLFFSFVTSKMKNRQSLEDGFNLYLSFTCHIICLKI